MSGPQPGLGFFGSAPRAGGRTTDLGPLTAQVNTLAAKVGGAIDRIEVAGTKVTFTTIDGVKHEEQLPGGTQPFDLTADGIVSALNRGEAPDSGFLAGLASGNWFIPSTSDAPNLAGRPGDMTGAGVLFKSLVKDKSNKNKGVMMLYGENNKQEDTMWVRFKTDGNWSSWIEYRNAAHLLSDLSKLVDAVKNQQLADKQALDALTKTVADDKKDIAALKLEHIPTMDEIKQHLEGEGWGALTHHLTTDEVKKALSSAGWGPIPTQITVQDVKDALTAAGWGPTGTSGRSGDRPSIVLPEIHVLFNSSVPSDLSGSVSSTTGEASVHKIGSGLERIWVLVEKDQAAKVKSIKIGDSLPSVWDSRDVSISGTAYTAFYSAGGFSTLSETITVKFG